MSDDLVLRTDNSGLATLTLNRPQKLNSLTLPLFEQLSKHIDDISAAQDKIGVVVLRGAGKCFCAGYDLGTFGDPDAAARHLFQAQTIEKLANMPQPVITAVHSHCYTGGLELALGGNIIVASANALFADTHGKWGMAPIWGMSQRLPRRVGAGKALELMLTSRSVTGAEAEKIGLVEHCYPDAEFDASVEALVRAILENSWFSHRENKKFVMETDGMELRQGLAHEYFRHPGFAPDMFDRIGKFTSRK